MKLFTAGAAAGTGIELMLKPFPHVGVGEEGRGRQYGRLPLGQRLTETLLAGVPVECDGCGHSLHAAPCGQTLVWSTAVCDCVSTATRPKVAVRVKRASVVRSRDGALLLVEEHPGDGERALVALRIAPGYRGGVEYYGRGITQSDVGNVPDPLPAGVELLRGYTAQGDAGRMGGGPELLVVMQPGDRIVAHRTGRLYGQPRRLAIDYDGERVLVRPLHEVEQAEAVQAAEADGGDLV